MTSKTIWFLHPSRYDNIVLRQSQLLWLLILLEGHRYSWLEVTKLAVGSNPFLSTKEQNLLLPSMHSAIRQSPVAPHEPSPTKPAECCCTGSTQKGGSIGRRAAKTLVNILLVGSWSYGCTHDHMVSHHHSLSLQINAGLVTPKHIWGMVWTV